MKQAKLSFARARTIPTSQAPTQHQHNKNDVPQQQQQPLEQQQVGNETDIPQQSGQAGPSGACATSGAADELSRIPGIPSIEEIMNTYDTWKLQIPENIESLHGRTKRSWKAKYNPDWQCNFPWIQTLTVGTEVVGILCSVCRSKASAEDSRFSCVMEKSLGKFVKVPFVRFGNFVDTAKVHEFGNQVVPKCGVKKFREQVVKGSVEAPNTLHMRVQLAVSTQSIFMGNNISQQLTLSDQSLVKQEKALHMCISQLHYIIKRRDSPFSSFKNNMLFNIEVLHCHIFKCLLRGGSGLSHGFVKDMIKAVYLLVLLGIYKEMADHLTSGEPIIFGGMIDLGSKVKKTKEYAGIAIKTIGSNFIISRVIGFLRCPTKDGYSLMEKLLECFHKFNQNILFLYEKLGDDRFPVKVRPLPLLDIANMNSLGIDGACFSKHKMISKRVLQYNPRCVVNWCGDHRASLVAGDILKVNQRHNEAHDVSMRVYDLINASARFSEQFAVCQVNTGDAVQFKGGKAVVVSSRPMHRWESSLKFIALILMLLRSVESFMAIVIQRKWATNARNTNTYAVHWLAKRFTKPKYLVTIATEADVLEILVHFIKQTEFSDTDVLHYQECVSEVMMDLNELILTPGKYYKKMETDLSGRLSEWAGDETVEQWRDMRKESVEMYKKSWLERFQREEDEELQMFGFFSIRAFRSYVSMLQQPAYRCSGDMIEKVVSFGAAYEQKLIDFYLKRKEFVAEYPEAQGQIFVAEPIGDEETLRRQFRRYKTVLYRCYLEVNPATNEHWKTRDILTNLLYRSRTDVVIQSWLYPGTPLFHIIKCYLCQITETAEVERLMSVLGLQDSKLNQGSTPEYLERMVIIQKESPSWEMFDSAGAAAIWRCFPKHTDDRRIVRLPPLSTTTLAESEGKVWLKSVSTIRDAHLRRKELWERKYHSKGDDHAVDILDPDEFMSDESEVENNEDSGEDTDSSINDLPGSRPAKKTACIIDEDEDSTDELFNCFGGDKGTNVASSSTNDSPSPAKKLENPSSGSPGFSPNDDAFDEGSSCFSKAGSSRENNSEAKAKFRFEDDLGNNVAHSYSNDSPSPPKKLKLPELSAELSPNDDASNESSSFMKRADSPLASDSEPKMNFLLQSLAKQASAIPSAAEAAEKMSQTNIVASQPSIVDPETHFVCTPLVSKSDAPRMFESISLAELKLELWVIVSYSDNFFIGQIIKLFEGSELPAKVKCLKSPYGCHDGKLQEFERAKFWVRYRLCDIYRSPVIPESVIVGTDQKWKYW